MLHRFRLISTVVVLAGLLFPFVFQQTFYPFFRFGMFAEPVRGEIQQERFMVLTVTAGKASQLTKDTGIKTSNMDYLLRNYYYRHEADLFLKRIASLLPDQHLYDTLLIARIIPSDSSIVARYPRW